MAGNLALLLNGIGIAVTFTILLVVANTMSIAVRERRTEIGVLKTLGFTQPAGDGAGGGRVAPDRAASAGPSGSPAAGASCGPSPTRRGSRTRSPASASPSCACSRWSPLLGLGVAVFLGFVAGFVPALGAYRARITDMLRTV